MKFETISPFGKTVANTEYEECVPEKSQVEAMLKAGYKFKLNGKHVNKKELGEFLSNIGEKNEENS